MRVGVFSSQPYDETFFTHENSKYQFDIQFLEARLNHQTAQLAKEFDVLCVFVNDQLTADVLKRLADYGTKHIALRCAGFNNVDLNAAENLGISVSRVPEYSPEAVAEHTIALILCLNRRLHKAYSRVRENNFNLQGLLGFNLHGKTIGIIGTGKIGRAVIACLSGFGCKIICYDPYPNSALIADGYHYVPLEQLFQQSDVISLHCPLTEANQHMINASAVDKMKPGVMLINTSRGALIDTKAIIHGLKQKKVGALGLDVYEMESELFFQDLSCEIVTDDVFQRLATFPNVLITGHQGFFTEEALHQISEVTLANIDAFGKGEHLADTFLTRSALQ